MQEQDDIKRMKLVEASERAARRITASKGDLAKRLAKIYARGPLAAQLGDEADWLLDNAADTRRTQGKSLREVLTEAVAPLATDGLLGDLMPSALVSLLLSNHDPECRTPLERVPNDSLTVERMLAHVEALGTSMSPKQVGHVARRTMMVLLNHHAERKPSPSLKPEVPAFHDDPDPAAIAEPDSALSPAKTAGRSIRGYGRLIRDVAWVGGTRASPVGTVFEVLRLTEEEQKSSSTGQGAMRREYIVVWWDGRARMIEKNALVSATRADWMLWIKENES